MKRRSFKSGAKRKVLGKKKVRRPLRLKNKSLLRLEEKAKVRHEQRVPSPAVIPDEMLNGYQGLSKAAADLLLQAGKGNISLKKPTRSINQILFDNVFTFFNFINTALAVVVIIISFKDPRYLRNLLFMGVVFFNTAISIFQEIKAKLTIDKLSILTEPHAEVTRSAERMTIPVDQIVPGDLLHIKAGQQIVIDGRLVSGDGLEVDESLLTGEADPIRKRDGDRMLSGSVAMAGSGSLVVDKVSKDTFAARITLEAQSEKSQHSALMRGMNRLLKVVSFALFPLGILLFAKLFFNADGASILREQVSTVGLLISMLPEGLVLLTSVAMATSIVILGSKQALVQTVPSIETLARVDVLCLDKTGTITSGEMQLFALLELETKQITLNAENAEAKQFGLNFPQYKQVTALPPRLQQALFSFCSHFKEGNATQIALNAYFLNPAAEKLLPWKTQRHMAFSSKRKWSCIDFEGEGSWYVGAAEMLFEAPALDGITAQIEAIAQTGYRVLTVAHSPHQLEEADLDKTEPLADLTPLALIVIADAIRNDVVPTFSYFRAQNVALKIISGDHPYTVEGIARRAGIAGFEKLIDMSQVAEDADLSEIAEQYQLFGRVSPFQKRALLKALQSNGHTVAMTGDGVNDVLALKDADCGVAMASGSEAARAAADIVLLDNKMSVMVDAVYEGRRVINNIQRIAPLFLIKTIYASVFAFLMLILPLSFPILPIQGTLISSATVGIPGFFLALKPNKERVSGTFLANVLPLALPPGISAALMLIAAVLLSGPCGLNEAELSTMAMLALILISLRALYLASLPFDWIKRLLFAICTLVPFFAVAFFPNLFMLALPDRSNFYYFLGFWVFTLALTEGLYKLFSTAPLRALLQKRFGKSRQDLLDEAKLH